MSLDIRTDPRTDIRMAIHAATAALAEADVPSARHDAEALAAHLLGVDRVALVGIDGWPAGTAEKFAALVDRRAAREPLQHLTGVAYFRYLELAVGPGVFVPRPETELLVDLVLPDVTAGAKVVDLCAGSGAIGLALATERPGSEVHLVEVDPAAADWLDRNVAALAPHATIHRMNANRIATELADVDVVVSNPPYLLAGEPVDPEVAADPALALWGGRDGLDVVREVVGVARQLLVPGGLLALEHDASHQDEVRNLLSDSGFQDVTGHHDLTGRPRFVTGRIAGR